MSLCALEEQVNLPHTAVRGASELEEKGESMQMKQKGEDGEEWEGPSALGALGVIIWHEESCETVPHIFY